LWSGDFGSDSYRVGELLPAFTKSEHTVFTSLTKDVIHGFTAKKRE